MIDEPYMASGEQIKVDPRLTNVPIVGCSDIKNYTVPQESGGMFLASAYLLANQDKGKITITPEFPVQGISHTNIDGRPCCEKPGQCRDFVFGFSHRSPKTIQ